MSTHSQRRVVRGFSALALVIFAVGFVGCASPGPRGGSGDIALGSTIVESAYYGSETSAQPSYPDALSDPGPF